MVVSIAMFDHQEGLNLWGFHVRDTVRIESRMLSIDEYGRYNQYTLW